LRMFTVPSQALQDFDVTNFQKEGKKDKNAKRLNPGLALQLRWGNRLHHKCPPLETDRGSHSTDSDVSQTIFLVLGIGSDNLKS